mmetsp:Transcript_91325/g.133524  ORF Transcript_91325/g.133524 Transcript_91325/m.133524 type:complete len:93 (+) Transcript_91325:201-479(+)
MYIHMYICTRTNAHTHTQQYSCGIRGQRYAMPEIIEVILLSPAPTPFRRRTKPLAKRNLVKQEPSESSSQLDEASAAEQLKWQQVEDAWRYE